MHSMHPRKPQLNHADYSAISLLISLTRWVELASYKLRKQLKNAGRDMIKWVPCCKLFRGLKYFSHRFQTNPRLISPQSCSLILGAFCAWVTWHSVFCASAAIPPLHPRQHWHLYPLTTLRSIYCIEHDDNVWEWNNSKIVKQVRVQLPVLANWD
jgi:hypothetical protein